jgi:ubiquinone/menaquinone biosynthesis C-methylase UbiE
MSRVGFYRDQVLPRALDLSMRRGTFAAQRAQVTAGLDGEVLEIGFGTGLNIPFYPAAVRRVLAVEPADGGRTVASRRLAARASAGRPVPVEFAGLDAAALPAADASMDHVLSTWTLCTVPDAGQALAEIHRVLRPGGTLHFAEHGLAPDPAVVRMQRRLNPVQRRLVGGCHLDRPIPQLITDAGFRVTELETGYLAWPRALSYSFLGVASKL